MVIRGSLTLCAVLSLLGASAAAANTTIQATPFSQNWNNTGLITTEDDWSAVPGIVAYNGEGMTAVTGTNPETILADGAATPLDVLANQTNPVIVNGGVAEFEGELKTVALQASSISAAPQVVIALTTTGRKDVTVKYRLRDIDGTTDDAVTPVALQFRVGGTGTWTNVHSAFVPDATEGPSLAIETTPVEAVLPLEVNDQALLQVRVMTTNAPGNDEWVGVDDIEVSSTAIATVADPGGAPPVTNPPGPAIGGPLTGPGNPSGRRGCKAGFHKKKVKGKTRCVKSKKRKPRK